MRRASWLAICCLLFRIPAAATSLVAARDENIAVIAIDSYFAEETAGMPIVEKSECKIAQIGPVFFAGAGIMYYGDFVVKDLAVQSLQKGKTFDDGLEIFTTAMVPALAATMSSLRSAGSPAYRDRIGKSVTEVVFATRIDGVPTVKVRYFMSSLAPDGSIGITPVEEECPGDKCLGGRYLIAMGEHDVIDRYNTGNKFSWIAGKLPGQLRDFVQMEIDEEARRAASASLLGQEYRIHVASPISVLEIDRSGAHWATVDGVEMSGTCSALPNKGTE